MPLLLALLAENHLTWRLFRSMLRRMEALPLPAGYAPGSDLGTNAQLFWTETIVVYSLVAKRQNENSRFHEVNGTEIAINMEHQSS